MITIPKRLQRKDFRFIKVKSNKAPKEERWQNFNNYAYDDKGFQEYLKSNKMYGVVCGYNNLIVPDFDSEYLQNKIIHELPKTFTVKSAGRGLLHTYFITDKPESFKVIGLNKETLADIQGTGKQVIGAGSTLDNGRKYEVVDNSPIAFIKFEKIKQLFSKYDIAKKKPKSLPKEENDPICKEIKEKIKVKDVLNDYGVDTTDTNTGCPLHTDTTGRCLSYNDDVWHCFDCEKSGNIFHLVMEKEGISFIQAKEKLAEKAGIIHKSPPNEEAKVHSLKDMLQDGVPEVKWRVQNIVPITGTTILGGASGSLWFEQPIHGCEINNTGTLNLLDECVRANLTYQIHFNF